MALIDNVYNSTVYKSRYARYLPEQKRREEWPETVQRLVDFLVKTAPPAEKVLREEVQPMVLNLDVLPSMRLLMTAGPACERENLAAFNCSFITVTNKRSFSEALYVLMNGTGVGFSCEKACVDKLPVVPELKTSADIIVVGDSKAGWAKAFRKLLSALWDGDIPTVDYSHVRPAGARLKTFGGRASGPDALKRLFEYSVTTLKGAQGRKLTTLEVHDLFCVIGEVVVVGGVRRAALISLSDLGDRRLRDAKAGAWYVDNPHRALANNSAVYDRKPDAETFLEEWLALVRSKSGERGIFNRQAGQRQASRWGRREANPALGLNPCAEVLLRPQGLCNLSEAVVRAADSVETLANKVRYAALIGTIQSMLTNFGFVSEEWKRNAEEERLLGVSLTGIMDNKALSTAGPELSATLNYLRDVARKENELWAEKLGISASAAITCVKPSGTVSQLVDCASGIHPRHNPHYIRRIRMDKKDPLCAYLSAQGIPMEDEKFNPSATVVFSFPSRAPDGALCRKDLSAIDHLELWLAYKKDWCEHSPSATITVKDDEWAAVGAWVFDKFDEISGLAFLPYSEHSYVQAPYEDITAEKYAELVALAPRTIDWSDFVELEDFTVGGQTLACQASNCEIQ